MDEQAAQASKAALRERMIAVRAALPAAAREEASAAICSRLRTLPELAGRTAVAGYAAFGAEASVEPFLRRLLDQGVQVLLPWVIADRIAFALVSDLDADLSPGWRGVREPRAAPSRSIQPAAVDAVLAPGVAFDRRGHRLGYGGGHFDRLLARVRRGVPVIGIAFDAQIVESVPSLPHDRAVELIVTESQVLRAGLDLPQSRPTPYL
ncbi:MAG TPA: 5-formyltetrahydrofolate cyclo-ligase [Egibacteraceae bacterium]|nr:5-formyltetrahydrofolate cyclo-ligase [Egibacteraceae bacterium]